MTFYIMDAFSEKLFGGNQAGVVVLPDGVDFPDDETMKKTDAELRYSETAFVKKLNDNEFQTRYFTPAAEVELCGHATIGTFCALLDLGLVENNRKYINHTLSGDLEIDIDRGKVLMDMATPVRLNEINTPEALRELYTIMGLDWDDEVKKGLKLTPQMVSTGLPDIMMPVTSLEVLESIDPDFPALAKLSEKYEVVGVHAFTTNCDDATCHVRNFAPLYEIDEEAATGTSNGALTYYGYLNGFVREGDDCKFIQGEKMGRPSVILSHIEADGDNVKVKVGGSAVILANGEIFI